MGGTWFRFKSLSYIGTILNVVCLHGEKGRTISIMIGAFYSIQGA